MQIGFHHAISCQIVDRLHGRLSGEEIECTRRSFQKLRLFYEGPDWSFALTDTAGRGGENLVNQNDAILVNTRNKFHISKLPYIVLFII